VESYNIIGKKYWELVLRWSSANKFQKEERSRSQNETNMLSKSSMKDFIIAKIQDFADRNDDWRHKYKLICINDNEWWC
jgi:hypothetical protein